MIESNKNNTSGQGANSIVPNEVKKHFNWGAFFIMPFWGPGNQIYIAIILLLPIFSKAIIQRYTLTFLIISILLSIWFGIKGNEWAWKYKKFENIEKFHSYQKKWAIAGIVFAIIFYLIPILGIIANIPLLLKPME